MKNREVGRSVLEELRAAGEEGLTEDAAIIAILDSGEPAVRAVLDELEAVGAVKRWTDRGLLMVRITRRGLDLLQ